VPEASRSSRICVHCGSRGRGRFDSPYSLTAGGSAWLPSVRGLSSSLSLRAEGRIEDIAGGSDGIGSGGFATQGVWVLWAWEDALYSLRQKSHGPGLRPEVGLFVVETRSYFDQYCFVSTPRSRPRAAAPCRAGLLPQAVTVENGSGHQRRPLHALAGRGDWADEKSMPLNSLCACNVGSGERLKVDG
jgi:hypothetical protein